MLKSTRRPNQYLITALLGTVGLAAVMSMPTSFGDVNAKRPKMGDMVRVKSQIAGPKWKIVEMWDYDCMIDNGEEQYVIPYAELTR